MAGKVITGLIQTACREHKPVGLLLKHEESDLYGFVVAVGEKLLLFAEHYDFIPNGFSIIALDDVEKVQAESAFGEKMIVRECLYERFGEFPQIGLNDWKRALEDIMAQEDFLAIELKDDGSYYPGKIGKVTARTVQMHVFDTEGVWGTVPYSIRHKNIGRVRLKDHYLETYVKYIPAMPELRKDAVKG